MGVRDRAYMHHRDPPPASRISTRRVLTIGLVLIGLGSWYRLTHTVTDQARPTTQQAAAVSVSPRMPLPSPAHRYQQYLDAIMPESDALRAVEQIDTTPSPVPH